MPTTTTSVARSAATAVSSDRGPGPVCGAKRPRPAEPAHNFREFVQRNRAQCPRDGLALKQQPPRSPTGTSTGSRPNPKQSFSPSRPGHVSLGALGIRVKDVISAMPWSSRRSPGRTRRASPRKRRGGMSDETTPNETDTQRQRKMKTTVLKLHAKFLNRSESGWGVYFMVGVLGGSGSAGGSREIFTHAHNPDAFGPPGVAEYVRRHCSQLLRKCSDYPDGTFADRHGIHYVAKSRNMYAHRRTLRVRYVLATTELPKGRGHISNGSLMRDFIRWHTTASELKSSDPAAPKLLHAQSSSPVGEILGSQLQRARVSAPLLQDLVFQKVPVARTGDADSTSDDDQTVDESLVPVSAQSDGQVSGDEGKLSEAAGATSLSSKEINFKRAGAALARRYNQLRRVDAAAGSAGDAPGPQGSQQTPLSRAGSPTKEVSLILASLAESK